MSRLARGGTSLAAATLIDGKQIKPHTIAANRLTGSALEQLRGRTGAKGPAGPAGSTGATGATGPAGAAGSAVAYAHVNSDATLDAAHSKNVSSTVGHPQTGVFCLEVTVPVTEASATVDTGGNGGNFGYASVVLSGQDPGNLIGAVCGPNYNVIVGVAGTTGANANYSNWVTFN